MANMFQLDVVSAEKPLFSGKAQKLFISGMQGELEILPRHAPLLTSISPGPLTFVKEDGSEESLVVFGGMVEVQPFQTTVLADAVLRAEEMDEKRALAVKDQAEKAIAMREEGLDYEKAHSELAIAIAQLRILKKLRKGVK